VLVLKATVVRCYHCFAWVSDDEGGSRRDALLLGETVGHQGSQRPIRSYLPGLRRQSPRRLDTAQAFAGPKEAPNRQLAFRPDGRRMFHRVHSGNRGQVGIRVTKPNSNVLVDATDSMQ